MENNKVIPGTPDNTVSAANSGQGKWVAVDAAALGGIPANAQPGVPFQGADGAMYCVKESPREMGHINSNLNNAIPTPSSIVQMPPIVQPIALVPYTSQNQPLLQYDPYSRPAEPTLEPKAPKYVKKPYKGISIASFIIALLGIVAIAVLSVATFKTTDIREGFISSGADMISSLLAAFGLAVSGNYYDAKIAPNLEQIPKDTLSTVIVFAIPVCVTIILVIFLVLAIKYIVKLGKKKSPRCFSVAALINIILSISVMALIIGMSNGEVASGLRGENLKNFFMFKSTIFAGAGLIISFIFSLVLLILPLCARKNAYMLEKTDNSGNTYIIND